MRCPSSSVRLNRKGDPISSFRIGDKPSSATEMRRVLAEAGLRGTVTT